ncbi:MAG TPA: PAS domain S-box protein [Casimicrobiaceae bacterium]|nr:PAS domain S-box protein [Casimicrobiaceae bacterium]
MSTPSVEAGVEHDRTLSQIARGLTWVGTAFLVASAAVIVWAVFRTVGVDDLIVALTVAGLGLGLPAIVAFVVAWVLNSLGHDGDAADADADEPARPLSRAQLTDVTLAYAIAVLACVGAWAVRAILDPLLGHQMTYSPLLMAVAFAAWYGGLGPAVVSTLLGGAIAWYAYLSPGDRWGAIDIQDAVQLGLYGAAALCIGGIASALRASRERAHALAREVLSREAGLEQARGELAAERDRSEVTLRAITDAVIATDAQGNITFVNDCATSMTGWPAAEAIGRPLGKVFRTLDEKTRRWLDGPLDAATPRPDDSVLVARDGTERLVEFKTSAIRDERGAGGYVLVFRDVTQARHARAALEESEARFRVLADQMPVLVWMCDAACALVYANRSWLTFTGRSLEQELGDGWTSSVHPEDFGPRQEAFTHAFERRAPFTLEYRLRRRDGSYRWVLDTGTPRFEGDGTFAGYIDAGIDITERKDAEATLGAFEQRKSMFLAALAHELRNPLAPIRSSIELMRHLQASDDPRVARAHEIIERQSARLAEVVGDLLDLSRIDSGNVHIARERVDVAQAVERAVARHAASIRDRGQQLAIDITPRDLAVIADAERLTQVIGNLVGNASKFTPKSGDLRIAAARVDDAVEITVTDTGQGIDASVQPRLFDLFDRYADRVASQGLGTGLAIVGRLVKLMGGSVAVDSAGAGYGSAFTVTLPAAAAAREASDAAVGVEKKRAYRLLVVDDNVDAADALATLLAMNGFDVQTAHDPDTAMASAIAIDPDVIVLDIGLPGMTGYELAQKLHAHPIVARAKLLALTGYGQPRDTEQAAKAAGFSGYLVKPVDSEQLRARIDALLATETPDARH